MANSRIITGACALVGALGLVATGAALSNAASPSSAPSAAVGYAANTEAPDGSANPNNDTPVTGTELANVKAAVKAKDSAVTVTSVRKDPDGSYDVFGTKAGANVRLEVSKDLKTITVDTDNHGGGPRG